MIEILLLQGYQSFWYVGWILLHEYIKLYYVIVQNFEVGKYTQEL